MWQKMLQVGSGGGSGTKGAFASMGSAYGKTTNNRFASYAFTNDDEVYSAENQSETSTLIITVLKSGTYTVHVNTNIRGTASTYATCTVGSTPISLTGQKINVSETMELEANTEITIVCGKSADTYLVNLVVYEE